jgi:4-hydroxy-3-methylbut-2-en-1-yl diphosphate reductase
MITAHGTSDTNRERLRGRGLQVIEATCPLVRLAHRAVLQLARDGFHPVVIGQRGHAEVEGLTGDLAEFDVVLLETDVARLRLRARFGVISQTTQPLERVRRLVALIRARFPGSEVRFVNTVCRPTKERQMAATELALHSDVVVVIGGANSNNTRELAATCGRYCSQVRLVQSAAGLRPEWFTGVETVGVTAGTSTPDEVIAAVEDRLREFAGLSPTPAPGASTQEAETVGALVAGPL